MPHSITTAEGRLAIALDCAATIDQEKRPNVPTRPAALPCDEDLIALNESRERGERLGATDDKIMQRFFAWRHAVMKQESKCQGRIETLFFMARILIEAKRTAEADRIAMFLHIHYGVPEVPADAKNDKAIAHKHARRREVLPVWLITMKRSDLERSTP